VFCATNATLLFLLYDGAQHSLDAMQFLQQVMIIVFIVFSIMGVVVNADLLDIVLLIMVPGEDIISSSSPSLFFLTRGD